MIVGQNPGDVPVSRSQGLQDVCAGVRLEDRRGLWTHWTVSRTTTATAPLLTIEVDMEMWKNFPRPPWGIALVKKNLCPSWEKSGASFCRGENQTCPQGLFYNNHEITSFTHLSVQPALTLILVFLEKKKKSMNLNKKYI